MWCFLFCWRRAAFCHPRAVPAKPGASGDITRRGLPRTSRSSVLQEIVCSSKEASLCVVLPFLFATCGFLSSPSGSGEAGSEWGHNPARLAAHVALLSSPRDSLLFQGSITLCGASFFICDKSHCHPEPGIAGREDPPMRCTALKDGDFSIACGDVRKDS